jgi:gliding motility-associated-like protein
MAELWATGSEGEPHWYVQPEDTLVHVGTNFLALAGIESTYMVTMQTSVCTSDVAWVTLFGKDCYGLIAPNIFTPNGDGMNDYFQVYVVEGTCYKLEIYNRWGNLVHQSELVNSEWDGTMMTTGKKLSDGVYFWLLDYCDVDGASHEAKGTVTLSRGE